MRVLLALALLACSLGVASAALTLPAAVSSHMVLQRNTGATIWGWTDQISGNVQVVLNSGEAQSVQAAKDGSWVVDLGKQAASTDNTITISDSTGSVQLTDVAFGDVILCSGQSNMEFSVVGANNATAEIADSINYPNLRMFTVASNTSLTPLTTFASATTAFDWTRSGPAAFQTAQGAWGLFSATCYFTGRDLYIALGGQVPIGLVASYWGGTPVEAWSSPDALGKCPSVEKPIAAVGDELDDSVGDGPAPNTPSVLWNAMIHPLLPMRFHLALWYQGEANAGNPTSYACRFPAMISDWRAKFALPLPFFFVQLAAYLPGGMNWPAQQIAQTAALQLPNVGMATAMDLGDPTSPEGDIHPRFKQQVGARLVRTIAAMVYGQNDVVYTGPLPLAVGVSMSDPTTVVVTLNPAKNPQQQLSFAGTTNCGFNMSSKDPGYCCNQFPFVLTTRSGASVRASEVDLGVDRLLVHVAAASIKPGDVITQIAYAYEPYPQCALYNAEGLPMTVFQSNVATIASAATAAPKQPRVARRRPRGHIIAEQ